MTAPILWRSIHDRRRATLAWALGIVSYTALIIAFYPSIKNQAGLNDLVNQYPKALMALFKGGANVDFTSGTGYVGSQLLTFMVPLVLMALAIGVGAAAIAGEERRGTLDLLMSYPVSRRTAVIQKAGALTIEVALVAAIFLGTILAGAAMVGIDLDRPKTFVTVFAIVFLALDLGFLALAIGCATGAKATASAVAAAVAGLSYIISALAPLVEALNPVTYASPFWYATSGSPLTNGVPTSHLAVLALVAGIELLVSVVVFERRDIRG